MAENNENETDESTDADVDVLTFSKQTAAVGAIILLAVAAILYMQFSGTPEAPTQPQDMPEPTDTTPDNPDEVLATVNGVEITARQVSQAQQGAGPRQQVSQDQALQQLISQQLLQQAAADEGYTLSRAQAEQELQARLQQQNLTVEQYKQRLQAQGMSYEDRVKQAQEQLGVQQYVEDQVDLNTTVTDQQARNYYDRLSQQSQQEVPPFEQVRERVKQQLRQRQQQQAVQSLVDELRTDANITRN